MKIVNKLLSQTPSCAGILTSAPKSLRIESRNITTQDTDWSLSGEHTQWALKTKLTTLEP